MAIKKWGKHILKIAEKRQQAREMFAEGAKNEDVARTLGVDLKVVIYWLDILPGLNAGAFRANW